MAGATMIGGTSLVPRQRPRSVLEEMPGNPPAVQNSGGLANTNPIRPNTNTARAQGGIAPSLANTSSLQQSRAAQQPEQMMQPQPAPPPPPATNQQVGQQVTNAYSLLLDGNNAAADQADRTAMTSLGNLQKAQDSDFNRTAATLGLTPGTAAYNAAKAKSQAPLLSQGSNILAGLAQKRLDDQARTLTAAGTYSQSGQRLTSDLEQRGVDNAFREGRADAEDIRFDKTFGASEDQRGKDNTFRTDRATAEDDRFDLTFGSSEDQRGKDNVYRDLILGDSREQQAKDNTYRDGRATAEDARFATTFGATEDQRGKDNVYRDLILGDSREQRAKDNTFRETTATQNQLNSLLANPDILSAAQLGQVKNAVAGRTGLDFQGLASDPNAAQNTAQEMVDWYVATGMSLEAAQAKAREVMMAVDPYEALVKANAETSGNGGTGAGGEDQSFTGHLADPLTPENEWATVDSASSVGKGIDNLMEGNVATGTGQLVGGVVSTAPNAARDVGHAVMEGSRAVTDVVGDAASYAKKKLNPRNWF